MTQVMIEHFIIAPILLIAATVVTCRMFKLHKNGGAVLGIITFIAVVLTLVPRGGVSLVVVLLLIFAIGAARANATPEVDEISR